MPGSIVLWRRRLLAQTADGANKSLTPPCVSVDFSASLLSSLIFVVRFPAFSFTPMNRYRPQGHRRFIHPSFSFHGRHFQMPVILCRWEWKWWRKAARCRRASHLRGHVLTCLRHFRSWGLWIRQRGRVDMLRRAGFVYPWYGMSNVSQLNWRVQTMVDSTLISFTLLNNLGSCLISV